MGGRLLAAETNTPSASGCLAETKYITPDHLGSTRVVTDAAATVDSRHDYLPFGKEIPTDFGGRVAVAGYGAEERILQRFTGKELDPETGLEYFGARYYSGRQGRFTSVDPSGESVDAVNPQTWNAYTYAYSNPLLFVDPDGESATLTGAMLGALIGGGTALLQGKSVKEINAAAAGGAIAGAMIGSVIDTGGASLGVLLASGGLSVAAGGAVERAILDKPTGLQEVVIDTAAGTAGAAAGVVAGRVTSAVIGRQATTAAGPELDLAKRAQEIHSALDPIAQRVRTTAVAEVTSPTGTRSVLVGSSRPTLPPAQRAVLRRGESAVSGPGHAEVTVINAAKKAGLRVKRVAASRPICRECEEAIRRAKAKPASSVE